jgi:RsiW-degrading membrane proteinase PrsW (M82 family)
MNGVMRWEDGNKMDEQTEQLGDAGERPFDSLRLPPFYFFWIAFGLVLIAGNLLLLSNSDLGLVFPILFWLGAALPTLAVIAWVTPHLGLPVSRRQGLLALIIGSSISVVIALVLEMILPSLTYFFLGPLIAPIELFFYGVDPSSGEMKWLIFFLLFTALQAPIPEEFAKAVGLPIFGRGRIRNERQAFMIGLWAGAGFAILENMLYEGVYAQWSGWSWGGVTLLRGIGSALHPLCTGLVALGWFRAREQGWGQALKLYGAAVGLHTLWNGGFIPLVAWTGLAYSLDVELSFYGEAVPILLVAYLALLAVGLWWLLARQVRVLAGVEEGVGGITAVSPRVLAAWAFACALIVIPLGAAMGPAWAEVQTVLLLR